MKKLMPVLLSALVAFSAAVAATLPIKLGGVRPVAAKAPKFSQIKFKIEFGPAAEPPQSPPNLTDAQLEAMAKFLIPDLENPPKDLPPELVYRLMDVLKKVDMHFKRPIPPAEWDQRLQEMRDEFVSRHGLPGAASMSAQDWEKSVDAMLRGFVKSLGDPHSNYMNRNEAKHFREALQGNFVGIGAAVDEAVDGVEIFVVFPNSPAENAGLIDGDVITAVDGVATKGQDIDTVVGRLRGPAGSQVSVRVSRFGQPLLITRAAVQQRDVFAKMAAPGIGYVYFSHFGPTTAAHLFAKIDELKASGATKLIIDVRGNLGGILEIADLIASEFLEDKDVIVVTKRQGQIATKAVTDGPGRYYGMRVAFILNGGSASASEVLAAALQEHGKAVVVGAVSYGKDTFQLVMWTEIPIWDPFMGAVGTRPDGTALRVTEGGWYTPGDRSVEGVHDPATGRNIPGSGGVKPDEVVTMTRDETKAARKSIVKQMYDRPAGAVKDAAYDKAVEVLSRP